MDRKFLYKLELIYTKYSPMIISIGLLISSILAYFDIYINIEVGYTCGTSLLTIGHLYSSSKLHKFCEYHRMFIHYIVVYNILIIYDYYIGVPLSDRGLLFLNIVIAGIFLFLILYYHQKCEDYVDEDNQETTDSDY